MKIVLASDNPGKLKEFQALLHDFPISLVAQSALGVVPVEETGLSFVENAILKARHAAKHTHFPALADDSGLVVDALHGAPGIYSARYGGIEKLLQNMQHEKMRRARFYCAIAFMQNENDPTPLIAQAQWEGSIATEPRGDAGFGYDPI